MSSFIPKHMECSDNTHPHFVSTLLFAQVLKFWPLWYWHVTQPHIVISYWPMLLWRRFWGIHFVVCSFHQDRVDHPHDNDCVILAQSALIFISFFAIFRRSGHDSSNVNQVRCYSSCNGAVDEDIYIVFEVKFSINHFVVIFGLHANKQDAVCCLCKCDHICTHIDTRINA